MTSITIDSSRNSLLSDQGLTLIKKFYLNKEESDPQEAFRRAAEAYSDSPELAQRIYDYASKTWFMFASPILSNAPSKNGKKTRGLPISCFLNHVGDTLEELMEHTTETRWLSIMGGGVGGHWSDVRAVSDIAPGPLPFLTTMNMDIEVYRQGKTRKGSYAAYLDVSHPDILEFITIRVPTGGDINFKCLNIHNAVNITDDFMTAVLEDKEWDLVCPHSQKVHSTHKAREIWERLLKTRYRTGEPYLNFIDTANKALPMEMKQRGLRIRGSNLCNEIHLPTSSTRTAVCCLSSLNIEKYEEWKDTTIVSDLIRFLDCVLQYFIDNAPDTIKRARYSAMRERSLGLGAMGFHSFLQSKNIPWESVMAQSWNKKIFKQIKEQAYAETVRLAKEKGGCPDVPGVRNSHLLAIAPNANSSILCNTSASIEPIKSNNYEHRTRAGSHFIKNTHLEKLLEAKGKNIKEVWDSICTNDGSVQHLDFLTELEKEVFKTSSEIDQRWVVQHAADRQPFICQGQSVNLFFPKNADRAYVNKVHLEAYQKGLKGLYYLRTFAEKKVESINQKLERKALKDYEECISCQG